MPPVPDPAALLISVDDKTGIQARSRKHPARRLPHESARREFEYLRHGTISIIAAMDVVTGEVATERISRNDSAHFIAFLTRLEAMFPPGLPLHFTTSTILNAQAAQPHPHADTNLAAAA